MQIEGFGAGLAFVQESATVVVKNVEHAVVALRDERVRQMVMIEVSDRDILLFEAPSIVLMQQLIPHVAKNRVTASWGVHLSDQSVRYTHRILGYLAPDRFFPVF